MTTKLEAPAAGASKREGGGTASLAGVSRAFGAVRGARRRRPRRSRAGRDRRRRRAQRLRQDDAARARLRPAGARRRHACAPTPPCSCPSATSCCRGCARIDNAALALRLAGASRDAGARAARTRSSPPSACEGFERARPARALRRHAPARRLPAHAAVGQAGPVPRRAVRRARRAHARARCRTGSRSALRREPRTVAARDPRRRGGGACSPTASSCSRRARRASWPSCAVPRPRSRAPTRAAPCASARWRRCAR